ncbi:nucleolar protein [Ephemerocybe angulata]|uniref:Nucleolar protein n=1 Tax=Ephemerocybe angulata TaxID=980116 RepID=A0A8H6MEG5_9AGAR|nr:nucleolar protein [Tulosesus angulatus]
MLSPSSSSDDASDVEFELLSPGGASRKKKKPQADQHNAQLATKEKKKKRKVADKADGATEGRLGEGEPRKKKKKKEKAREKEILVDDDDSDIDANAEASTAALLNAIVAAVSNTTPPEEMTPAPQAYIPPPPPMIPHAPFFPPGMAPDPNSFPASMLNDLTYGTNDDVLHAMQNVDMSKMPGVMKTFGSAGPSMDVSAFAPPPSFAPLPHAPPPPVGQLPAGSMTILNVPKTTVARHTAVPASSSDDQTNSNHAHILSTKWLNARKLAEMVVSDKLVYKKGKFSATEERQLKDAIEAYKKVNSLSDEQMQDVIFPKNEKVKDNAFWTGITKAVPQRPIIAVYHHVRRKHHPMKHQGAWEKHEDDALKAAVADLGQAWEKVSPRVGRMASDCRDRYRNHILGRETRVAGAWSKEEEAELTRIVTDMTIKQGRDIDNDVFWSRVSHLMGGRRGRQQCRIKWTDSLSKLVKNDGAKPRWSPQDAYILVHKVDSLNVNDDTEIDWKTLPDPDWNLWSAHTLQRRWLTMKRSIKGHEEMSHQEIVDILRVKKSLLPDILSSSPSGEELPAKQPPRKRKERKIISADEIQDESPTAGTSTELGASPQSVSSVDSD